MLDLERGLQARFPDWFRGARAPLSRAAIRGYSHFSGWSRLQDFVRANAHLRGHAFVEAALDFLECRYLVDHREREHIPERGRVVIVANHPMGGIDALALLACVGSIRRDVKIIANDVLSSLDGLADLIVPVPTFAQTASPSRLRSALNTLENDGALIVFPAAEVSRLTLRGIRDARWRDGFLRLAQRAQAPVLPVRIEGRNSAFFYGMSALFKPLGTPLLPRELLSRRGSRIVVRVAAPRLVAEFCDGARSHGAQHVRRAVYAIGRRDDSWRAPQAPIVHRPACRDIRRDLDRLPMLGETADGKRIHAGRLATDSALLREIARLRETTFRRVGEGTGRRLDTDVYDGWYDHIVLWDAQAGALAGAYRALACAPAIAARGREALYSASLFDLDASLAPMLEAGVELGRSFVAPEYWGTRSLDCLWYGIGAWLRTHPEIRYLFGPVSISASLPLAAREWLVAYYHRYYGEPAFARAARPFRFARTPPDFGDLDARGAMSVLRGHLDVLGARIPALYKQYVELCEPGGAAFLAFGVDAGFNDSIDGLIRVDLQRVKAHRFQRYLAPRAAGMVAGVGR